MDKQKYFRSINGKVVGLIALATVTYTGNLLADDEDIVNLGSMQATDLSKERGIDLSGRAMILKRKDGTTSAYAQVVGLSPNTNYGSHVHNLPCSLGGGGHYKNDPDVPGAVQSNEIWLSFTTNDSGIGLGQGTGDFSVRPEAQSIVVHDTDGGRIGCADLNQNNEGATVHRGDMMSLTDGTNFGTAQLGRSNGSTYSILKLEGLTPNTTYPSHVHNLSCDINKGGSHYKIDPSISTTEEDNEIWLTVTADSEGKGFSTLVTEAHNARPEAQSVVVHAPDGSRIGCADLYLEEADEITTSGNPITTEAGLARGIDLTGKASMKRKGNGKTRVKIKAKGLSGDTTYPTHVHNLPCKLGGGSHYKIDPAIGETLESNEIWPFITTNYKGKGKANVVVHHIARPEAQSLVIHDPADGARIGCFDLD